MTLNADGIKIDSGQKIRDSSIDLTEAAGHLNTHASNIKRGWLGLGGVYSAPEQEDVLAAMDKPATEAADLKTKVRTVGRALTAYGNRCDELQAQKNQLKIDIEAFYRRKADQDDGFVQHVKDAATGGWDDLQMLRDEEDLAGRIYQLKADLDEAQRTCANAITAIYGGPHYEAAGETSVWDKSVYGLTADGYDQLTHTGKGLDGKDIAWGVPEGWTSDSSLTRFYMIGNGALGPIKEIPGFFKDLSGWNGSGRAAAAWSGLGQLAFDGLSMSPATVLFVWGGVGPFKGVRDRTIGRVKATLGAFNTAPWDTAGSVGGDIGAAVFTKGGSAAGKQAIRSATKSAVELAGKMPKNIGDLAKVSTMIETKVMAPAQKLIYDLKQMGPPPRESYAGVPNGVFEAAPRTNRTTPFGQFYNKSDGGGAGSHDHPKPPSTGSGAGHTNGSSHAPPHNAPDHEGSSHAEAPHPAPSPDHQSSPGQPDTHQSPPDHRPNANQDGPGAQHPDRLQVDPSIEHAKPAEQRTVARMVDMPEFRGRTFKGVPPPDPGHDWVDDLGRTYDALGDGNVADKTDMRKFLRSVDKHLLKSNDFTVIDMTGYKTEQIAMVDKHLRSLDPTVEQRLIRVGF